jgi:hypothetical protein
MFELHYNEEMEAEVRRLEANNRTMAAVPASSNKEDSMELNQMELHQVSCRSRRTSV